MTTEEEQARFLAKVRKTDGCWFWTGYVQSNGYPKFRFGGRSSYAHRFSYLMHCGTIPEGLQLDHLCRTPTCVNPAHLEAVTNRENTVRGLAPVRAAVSIRSGVAQKAAAAWARAKTVCAQGHPYDETNTRFSTRGTRRCAQCARDRAREFWRKTRAAKKAADAR